MTDTHHTTDCSSVIGRKRPRSDEEKAATSSSSSSSLSSSSSESSWKTMYENEHTKNTMLNLQLCFVQSECMRLLNLQNDMANSIATLQVRPVIAHHFYDKSISIETLIRYRLLFRILLRVGSKISEVTIMNQAPKKIVQMGLIITQVQ